ncbi:MAG: thymidine phosphorylase [Deltaproteobacteria bacterium]|jgi:pyrimidine-nucleoside phosphorylase|nr:thymidine phosphorylase [Deltaproteobacteria bacterium]
MLIQDIIIKKRDKKELAKEEISWFIKGYSNGDIPDYQAAALLMAIFLNDMNLDELAALTDEMLHSGTVVDLSNVEGAKIDKHSTGGVGDKISIPLAPIVASCGVSVPMVSGRGLGHTGGTLDKLESIPGFNVNLPISKFRQLVGEIGVCLIGQTKDLAPADKKIYALRDATGTVPSIPLIASSIMSKKLAEGIDGLVLDVKVGTGAFMTTLEKATQLAQTLVGIGKKAGKNTAAFLTRMDDPLGKAVGNSCEIIESIEILKGRGPDDIKELTLTLAAQMLHLGSRAKSLEAGRKLAQEAINSGKALEKFEEIIIKQDGDPKVLEDYSRMPGAKHSIEIKAAENGWIREIDSTEIGMAGVLLGAGRKKVSDNIDPGVGMEILKKSGDKVAKGETLVILNYNQDKDLETAVARIKNAYKIGDRTEAKPLVYKVIQ